MQLRSLRRSLGTLLPLLVITAARVHAGGDPDHFLFYATDASEGAPKFVKFGPVHLVDELGAGDYEVTSARALGVPAEKNGRAITNAETHLQEFAIKATKGSAFVQQTGVRYVNQCNDIAIDVVKPVSLMVPSTKRLQAPAGPVPVGFDHYLCYQAKTKLLPKGMQVDVSDQFQARRYDLKKLTKLCLPVDKSGSPLQLSGPGKGMPFPITPATIFNPQLHMLCYQAKAASKVIPQNECLPWRPKDKGTKFDPKQAKHTPRLGVLVTGQFGTDELDTKNEVELCIPSIKNPVCGDGMFEPAAGEQCDDGNATSGDGCSAQCLIEIVSPVNEDLSPCLPSAYSDFWTFDVTAGENVVVRADTTAASTAADLTFELQCPGMMDMSGDDEVDCTFPPPHFSCPEVSFVALMSGSCVVQVHNFETCTSNASAAYSLTVTRNNAPARVALRDDDACAEICATFAAPGTYPFTVPKDVNEIVVDVFGAQGGTGRLGAQGGLGGRTVSSLSVTPGETLQINVGGRGGDGDASTGGAGGSNGGARGGATTLNGAGGGGGGASDIRSGTGITKLVVAGGGGGSGGGTDCCGGSIGGAGGAGGGINGMPGASVGGAGGGGATDTMGGTAGGAGADPGTSGGGGVGADGDGAGGGGGGGLFGGGGGAGDVNELGGGGGGGGSATGPSDSLLVGGQRSGHGQVRIIVR